MTSLAAHVCGERDFRPWGPEDVEGSLSDRFAAVADRHGDCPAVLGPAGPLTYAALDGLANRVAVSLLELDGASRAPVGVLLEQGVEAVVAVLGVLKAGRPYVPLDPRDPADGLAAALQRLGVSTVVTERSGAPSDSRTVEIRAALAAGPAASPGVATAPGDTAYVFATSGTTGAPKAVFDTHRNVLHNILRYTNALELAPVDRLTLLQAPSFSGSVSSLFGALLNGAACLPLTARGASARRLAEWVAGTEATVFHGVPSLFRTLVAGGDTFPAIRVVRLEGDTAALGDVELHRRHFAPGSVLANGLGTTETGLIRQLRLPHGARVDGATLPVGHAVAGVEVEVVDEGGAVLPPGELGEVRARSAYLAAGYWGDPELTARAFAGSGAERTYRTGDFGRLRLDGCLELGGRHDGSPKVRGRRVATADVEAALLELPEVAEAAVAVVPDGRGGGSLVAHIVPRSGAAIRPTRLRARLHERLPAALVPDRLAAVDALPLTAAGKVDRAALAASVAERRPGRVLAGSLERDVAAAFGVALERSPPTDDADFFDLGGDSLAAARLVTELERCTGLELRPSALLEAPTVGALAAVLRAGSTTPAAVPLGGSGPPLFLPCIQTGEVLAYRSLAAELGDRHAVWGLPWRPAWAGLTLVEIADELADVVEEREPEQPLELAGFCFGAVLALELGHALRARGRAPAGLTLLGVTPHDLPGLVTPAAAARFVRAHRPPLALRAARQAGTVVRLGPRLGTIHAARLLRRVLTGVPLAGQELFPLEPEWTVAAALRRLFAEHTPRPWPGRVTLVLSDEATSPYASTPDRDWAPLATEVGVHVLPGDDHGLLEPPIVVRAASLVGRGTR